MPTSTYWNDIDARNWTVAQALEKLKTPGFSLVITCGYIKDRWHVGANVCNHETRENYAVNLTVGKRLVRRRDVHYVDHRRLLSTSRLTYSYEDRPSTPKELLGEVTCLSMIERAGRRLP